MPIPTPGSARAGDRTLARPFSLTELELRSEVGRGEQIPQRTKGKDPKGALGPASAFAAILQGRKARLSS